ncbi:MAG: 4-alpha-glucanotransferase [Propionibacteriaceae bacterium]|jgi:4-alpha-glucanotransferase|nr:4-alpha-glucanotransferase [Propionibacteriaceae bacterium]
MSGIDSRLASLAHAYGIDTEFWDWKGHYRQPSNETLMACLRALGVDTQQEDWLTKAFIEADERVWLKPIPECIVVQHNQEKYVDVHVCAGRPAHVWVRLEEGTTFALDQVDNWEADRVINDRWIGRATFRLPSWVEPGYHSIFLESDENSWESVLIVTPQQVGVNEVAHHPMWGLMVQLYSVCGESSWGVGDFVDLAEIAVWAKFQHNADFILINPTHAAEVTEPLNASPYYPSTRRYINPIYIRPERIQEYATGSQETREAVHQHRHVAYTTAMAGTQIDRDLVWCEKKPALQAIFSEGLRIGRKIEFEAFIKAEGEVLKQYATWCVLTEEMGQDWTQWSQEYQDPSSEAVRNYAKDHEESVTFYMWLQWIADLQAKYAHSSAKNAGMRLGVMSDLAVGVSREGQETWARHDLFAKGVTVGAPPDAYNQAGQDWQQPPWRPDRLAATAYEPLRTMVSAIFAHSGAVRIDHILGQFRLWWIPEGMSASEGAYLRYDHEAMMGILVLEAHRSEVLIIGEDLGTVEPWVVEYLAGRGILGTSVIWFENSSEGHPLNPQYWRPLCLASVTTHDLPPTLGYLDHEHVELRYSLGLLTESLEDEVARDAIEQASVLRSLKAHGYITEDEDDHTTIMEGLYRFLYQTPSRLRCVALTDLVGEKRSQNQPGTIDEYPNWRVPLADSSGRRLTLEEIFEMGSTTRLTDIMNGRQR